MKCCVLVVVLSIRDSVHSSLSIFMCVQYKSCELTPFHSADYFQHRHTEEGFGELGPLYVNLYGKLNRANEIAERLIRVDLSMSEIIIAFIPCD